MKKLINKLLFWFYWHTTNIITNISISLYNTENELLKADPNNLQEKDKRIQRKLHRNPILEKFYAGKQDEKYKESYYEVLKKSDAFIRSASSHQIGVAADKYAKNYAQPDEWGRKFEHLGFCDEKHKNYGKSLEEVMSIEKEERRTKDDDYELLLIYDNKPIEAGFVNFAEAIDNALNKNLQYELASVKSFKYPIQIVRKDKDTLNKIEELTETLHIKKIGFEYRQLEFHIPLKYKTFDISENSTIFAELIQMDEVYIKNNYGELTGFSNLKFIKRIKHNDAYDVLKFEAVEMINVRS